MLFISFTQGLQSPSLKYLPKLLNSLRGGSEQVVQLTFWFVRSGSSHSSFPQLQNRPASNSSIKWIKWQPQPSTQSYKEATVLFVKRKWSFHLRLALTFLFLSRCLRTATAFLINPFDLRILKILLPVTKRTWQACRSVPLHHQK
uniref:Uncharacterized protein n=1 Tax=Meleagris gallopavo TaxID=9103 RepID=A0A803Y2L8_MELGA